MKITSWNNLNYFYKRINKYKEQQLVDPIIFEQVIKLAEHAKFLNKFSSINVFTSNVFLSSNKNDKLILAVNFDKDFSNYDFDVYIDHIEYWTDVNGDFEEHYLSFDEAISLLNNLTFPVN